MGIALGTVIVGIGFFVLAAARGFQIKKLGGLGLEFELKSPILVAPHPTLHWPAFALLGLGAAILAWAMFAPGPKDEPLTATATLTPVCAVYQECRNDFVGSCTNGSENNAKNCSPATHEFPDPDCEYVDHKFEITSVKDAQASAKRSENAVVVSSSAKRRPRFKGGTSRVAWSVQLIGRQLTGFENQSPIENKVGELDTTMDTLAFQVDDSLFPSCEIERWVLGGMLESKFGKSLVLPDQVGDAGESIVTSGSGFELSFNSQSLSGNLSRTASTPK